MKLTVFAHPNSKKPRVEKDLFGSLHVYVNQPPLEGKANRAVIEALAGYLKIAKSKISLVRGEKSKQKTFAISN
jgi:uncharacterized protein YggU (UPF0235/DUF167 family)